MDNIAERLKSLKRELPRYDINSVEVDNLRLIGLTVKQKELGVVNVRGANGSGKSSIPQQMLFKDGNSFIITKDGQDVLTVFPDFNFVALGKYYVKCGGLDTKYFQDKDNVAYILKEAWALPYNIIMEGIVCSSSFTFYRDLFEVFSKHGKPKREIAVMNIIVPLELSEKRVMARNGGKKINMKHVKGKLDTVKRNVPKFDKESFITNWVTSNEGITLDETVDWFFEELRENTKIKV